MLFLADGRIVDEMAEPTADRVLERLKAFDTENDRAAATDDATRAGVRVTARVGWEAGTPRR